MKRTLLAILALILAVTWFDASDLGDKVLRMVSRASYELNAFATASKGVESLCCAMAALSGAVWIWNRRKP